MMLQELVNRFTTVSIVGVDVGSALIKVVELARSDGQPILQRCGIARVEGDDAASLLKRLCADAGITTTNAALGLAAPGLVVKSFQVPSMPRKELKSALQLEAEQAILNGHALNQMASDWHVIQSPTKVSIRGLLAVVPKTILDTRLHMAAAAGLRPTVVDVEGLALWNAYWVLVGSRELVPQTVLLMNIGVRMTTIVVAKGPDELMLVRDVQLGGSALAEGQQREWITEVQDSLGYARSQSGLRTLDAVYVTGGGSDPKLIPLLKTAVNAPLTFWNPLNQLPRGASAIVEESVGPLLAVAIGLALRQPS